HPTSADWASAVGASGSIAGRRPMRRPTRQRPRRARASAAATDERSWGSSLALDVLADSVRQVAPRAQRGSGASGGGGFVRAGDQCALPPVDVGCIGLHGGELDDLRVAGREVTDRVGGGGVAGQREGLAAAAAEIDLAARTARAWLLHP